MAAASKVLVTATSRTKAGSRPELLAAAAIRAETSAKRA
jgi:hypothetical protein